MKKKLYLITLTMMLCLAAFSTHAATTTDNTPLTKEAIANMTPEQKEARLEEIKQRVTEIKAMDKSQLTRPERKELRTELKGLKYEAAGMGGGIYLSVGAIIIIILLLILLL
jgi:hypothetical protein